MAKSVSASKNRRIQKASLFSESEIDVAIQLIHLSEDSNNHDEISSSSSCSDDKFIGKTKISGGVEEDEGQSSRSGSTIASSITLIEDILDENQDDANRRRRKRRSRSVYEIYKLTKPIVAVN